MGEHITDLMPIHADRFPLNMDTKMKTNNLEMLSNETRFIQYICEYVHIHKRILWFGASFLILTSINLHLLLFCTHAALFLCNKGLLLTFFFGFAVLIRFLAQWTQSNQNQYTRCPELTVKRN